MIIQEIVFGYVDLFFLLFITIKSDMKIVIISENIFPFKAP